MDGSSAGRWEAPSKETLSEFKSDVKLRWSSEGSLKSILVGHAIWNIAECCFFRKMTVFVARDGAARGGFRPPS